MDLRKPEPLEKPEMLVAPATDLFDSEMSQVEFDLWSSLLKERTGMVLPVQRKSFLVTNLGLRMKELKCWTYQDYRRLLSSGVNGELEWKFLIDRLTVHETRFYRHKVSLDLVRDYVDRKEINQSSSSVTVQAWSVGCSTGEEAYSLAITIDQALASRTEKSYFGIVATDISAPSIKTARQAKFKRRQVQNHVPPAMLEKYFDKLEDDYFQVNETIRRRVCFTPMNILAIAPEMIGEMDIIYCQNLLIYFEREKRLEIVNELARYLCPNGIILLGAGELLGWKHPQIKKLNYSNALVYQRNAN